MADTLPKNTVITCPRKGHKIGVLNTDIQSGNRIMPHHVDFEKGQSRVAGEIAACKICGSQYLKDAKVHTSSGWKPSEPMLEPVSIKKGK